MILTHLYEFFFSWGLFLNNRARLKALCCVRTTSVVPLSRLFTISNVGRMYVLSGGNRIVATQAAERKAEVV